MLVAISLVKDQQGKIPDPQLLEQWIDLYREELGAKNFEPARNQAQAILRNPRRLKQILSVTNPLDPVSIPVGLALLEVMRELHQSDVSEEFLSHVKKYWIPIAGNFGMWKIRFILEDWLFKTQDTRNYELILSLLKSKDRIHQELFKNIIDIVGYQLKKKGIRSFSIIFRKKNTFGIHEKMQRKHQSINHINDFFAIRIIVKTLPECYQALEVLHYLWPAYMDRFKDYIREPKPNGYQGLHTVLQCLDRQIVEFQVRTEEMDYIAKFGPASHALYKKAARSATSDCRIPLPSSSTSRKRSACSRQYRDF